MGVLRELEGDPSTWTSYLYVIGCKDGPVKVGYSSRPDHRLRALIKEGRADIAVLGRWSVYSEKAHAAERYAHWLLRDHHIGHEWFETSRENAAAAIRKAVDPETLADLDGENLIPGIVAHDRKERKGNPKVDNAPWQRRAKLAGLTQRMLASLLGVTENTVSQQLRGRWQSGETPRYVQTVIMAWERLSPAARAEVMDAAQASPDVSDKGER